MCELPPKKAKYWRKKPKSQTIFLTPTTSKNSQICEIWRQKSQSGNPGVAPFLKTDNALCCITKYVMSKCRCLFEGMRDFRTSTRTKVFRFNQKFIKVLKCSAKFKCRPVGKIWWYWVWCTNPAAYKSSARWKPFSNARCCFTQVTRC